VTHLADKTAAIGMNKDERAKLIGAATVAVADTVYPAYRRLIAEEVELRKHATHDAGVWRLKDGDKYYADQLKLLTSTDMTPDEIHAYGLSEVTRISTEADGILKSVGLTDGTVGERLDKLMADPRFLFAKTEAGRQAQLKRYREILTRVKGELPKYFSYIPSIPLEVERVPVFAEKGSAGAYYERPTLDGSRPGIFFANLRDPAEAPAWAMPLVIVGRAGVLTTGRFSNAPRTRKTDWFTDTSGVAASASLGSSESAWVFSAAESTAVSSGVGSNNECG